MKGLKNSVGHRLTVMMPALKNLAQDKRKYREEENVAGQTCRKRARTSVKCPQVRAKTLVESPEEQQESSPEAVVQRCSVKKVFSA